MKTKDLKSGMTVRHQEWDSSRKPMRVVATGQAEIPLLKNLQDDTLPLTSPRASGEDGWILVYQLDEIDAIECGDEIAWVQHPVIKTVVKRIGLSTFHPEELMYFCENGCIFTRPEIFLYKPGGRL